MLASRCTKPTAAHEQPYGFNLILCRTLESYSIVTQSSHNPKVDPYSLKLLIVQVRAYIVRGAGKSLAKAVTIATRYSILRRQGFRDERSKQAGTGHAEHQVWRDRVPARRWGVGEFLAIVLMIWLYLLRVCEEWGDGRKLVNEADVYPRICSRSRNSHLKFLLC